MLIKLLRISLISVFPLIILQSSFAQYASLKFGSLNSRDGLVDNFILSIAQDTRGFMWFATEGGLSRYDGISFVNYEFDPSRPYLKSKQFDIILESKTGELVICGTNPMSITIHNPDDGSMTDIAVPESALNIFKSEFANVFELDTTIFVTIGTSFYRVDRESNLLLKAEKLTSTMERAVEERINRLGLNSERREFEEIVVTAVDSVTMLMYDKLGWFATLNVRTNDYKVLSENTRFGDLEFHIMDDYGNWWFSTETIGDAEVQLCTFNYLTKKYEVKREGEWIEDMSKDASGVLWMVGEDKMLRFDTKNDVFLANTLEGHHDVIAPSNHAVRIHLTDDDVVWIGYYSRGLSYASVSNCDLVYEYRHIDDDSTIVSDLVTGLSVDEKGRYWISSHDGISLINHETDDVQNWNEHMGTYTAVYSDSKDRIWVIEDESGHALLKKSNQEEFSEVPFEVGSLQGPVSLFLEGADGRVFLFTGNLVYAYDSVLEHFTLLDLRLSFNSQDYNLLSLKRGAENQVWVGTTMGLYGIDFQKNKVHYFSQENMNYGRLEDHWIWDIEVDNNNRLWVSTNLGLSMADLVDWKFGDDLEFKTISKSQGLPSSVVYDMTIVDEDHVWIFTNNGSVKTSFSHLLDALNQGGVFFQPTLNNFDLYVPGVVIYERVSMSIVSVGKNGEVVLASEDGVVVLDPEIAIENQEPIKTVLIDMKLFRPDSPVKYDLAGMNEVDLNHDEAIFSISFSTLNFSNVRKNYYAYTLTQGSNPKWNYTDNMNTVNFGELSPGKYKFMVKSSYQGKDVSNIEPEVLKITVLPPWWATWWMRISFVLLILTTGVLLYRMRINSLKRMQRHLERSVLRRTKEIEKQKLQLRKKNSELRSKNETITSQANELKVYNHALNSANENLERRVEKRTIELTEKNKTLEEHAFFNSHELRKPVTNVLGLVNLLNFEIKAEDTRKIVWNLKQEAYRLDSKVKEIQKKLRK